MSTLQLRSIIYDNIIYHPKQIPSTHPFSHLSTDSTHLRRWAAAAVAAAAAGGSDVVRREPRSDENITKKIIIVTRYYYRFTFTTSHWPIFQPTKLFSTGSPVHINLHRPMLIIHYEVIPSNSIVFSSAICRWLYKYAFFHRNIPIWNALPVLS